MDASKVESEKPIGEGDEGEHKEGEDEIPKEDTFVEPPKEYRNVPYTEKDYELRIPSSEYERIKEIEDEVLKFKKENLKVYVIGSGITYGNGETETVFGKWFKSAWLQKPAKLSYYGLGDNQIPTIHVKDLVSMVKKLYETKPEQQYVFAIDNSQDRS